MIRFFRERPARLVPLAILVAFIPALPSAVLPAHDSLQKFIGFWTAFSGLVTEGRLPEWVPVGRYGTPSTPILHYVTPMQYATAALGALLHVTDTFRLFKITVWLEYLIFGAGLLRFSRLLCRTAWIPCVVAILGVISSPWVLALDFNFHAYYMMPWVLAYLTLAFQSGRARYLGLASLFTVFACVGNVMYEPPILLLEIFIFALPLMFSYPQNARRLATSPVTWILIAIAGVLAALHFGTFIKGVEGLAYTSGGRDPLTNRVTKDVFLTYAGVTHISRWLVDVLTGRVTNGDNTFYVGLGALALFPLALVIRTSPPIRALLLLAVFLFLFSTGGLVASISYYFPGMWFYRHVSMVFGVIRIAMLLCAGCVLDRMLTDRAPFGEWRRLFSGWRLLVIACVLGLAAFEVTRAQLYGPPYELALFGTPVGAGLLAFRIACYVVPLVFLWRRGNFRALPYALALALLIDLGTFWASGWQQWPHPSYEDASAVRQAAVPAASIPPPRRITNADAMSRNLAFRALRIAPPFTGGTLYVHTYAMVGVDPCVSQLRNDFLPKPVADLFARRGIAFDTDIKTETRVLQDDELTEELGCRKPRIRFTGSIVGNERGTDWIRMTVENSAPSNVPMTISESQHPGWTVRVDGHPGQMDPADQTWLSTMVPPGRHDIEFRFHTIAGSMRTLEAWLAGLAALAILILSMQQFWVART